MNNPARPVTHRAGHRWRDARRLSEARVLILFAMGFSSGLALLVFGTLRSGWRRGGCQPDRHRLHELGGAGLRLQVAVVAPGGSAAPCPCCQGCWGRRSWMLFSQVLIAPPWWDGLLRSQDPARPAGPLRPAGCLLLHPGHHVMMPIASNPPRAAAGGHGRVPGDGYRLAAIMAGQGAWRWRPGSAATAAMTIAAGSSPIADGGLMSLASSPP